MAKSDKPLRQGERIIQCKVPLLNSLDHFNKLLLLTKQKKFIVLI